MQLDEFKNNNEEHMYQVPHKGEAYDKDNGAMYLKLKEYLCSMCCSAAQAQHM